MSSLFEGHSNLNARIINSSITYVGGDQTFNWNSQVVNFNSQYHSIGDHDVVDDDSEEPNEESAVSPSQSFPPIAYPGPLVSNLKSHNIKKSSINDSYNRNLNLTIQYSETFYIGNELLNSTGERSASKGRRRITASSSAARPVSTKLRKEGSLVAPPKPLKNMSCETKNVVERILGRVAGSAGVDLSELSDIVKDIMKEDDATASAEAGDSCHSDNGPSFISGHGNVQGVSERGHPPYAAPSTTVELAHSLQSEFRTALKSALDFNLLPQQRALSYPSQQLQPPITSSQSMGSLSNSSATGSAAGSISGSGKTVASPITGHRPGYSRFRYKRKPKYDVIREGNLQVRAPFSAGNGVPLQSEVPIDPQGPIRKRRRGDGYPVPPPNSIQMRRFRPPIGEWEDVA